MILSVRLMTYNHSAYIIDALDGINIQQTTFPFEVVIGDDFSSDDTLAKINAYRITNPNLHVRVLERQQGDTYDIKRRQFGRLFNFANIIENCTARYIALLDGDDYWSDPLKLQKQVDFLEKHPNLNVCFTNRSILSQGMVCSESISSTFIETPFSYSTLLEHHNFIVTATVLFRTPKVLEFPDWFYQLPYGDLGLYKLLSTQDDFYGLADDTAVYRVHEGGVYSGVTKLKSRRLYYKFYKIIYPYLSPEEKTVSKKKMKQLKLEIASLRFAKHSILRFLYRFFI